MGIHIDETEQFMFLDAIDAYTSMHLKILSYFSDPLSYFKTAKIEPPQMIAGRRSEILEQVMPELTDKLELLKLVVNDLYSRGFMTGDSVLVTAAVSHNELYEMLVTTFGRQFLQYISTPNVMV